MFDFYKHHKRKITKWFLRIVFGSLLICIYLLHNEVLKKDYEKKLAVEKYNFVVGTMGKQLEEVILINKNLTTQMAGFGNEGIWIKDIINKSKNQYFQSNMTEHQKELQVKEHGKDYKLLYDWMEIPLEEFYIIKGGEFAQPRYYNDTWFQHTGVDPIPTKTKEVKNSFDGIVTSKGFDDLGGYYIIVTTIRNEYDEKTKKYKDNKYENYYGHLFQIDVELNQEVKKGDRIGIVGQTGKYCFGEHLHWSIKRNGILMNPFINKTWKNNKLVLSIKASIMCY